jgi:hypothetical protein
MDKIGSGIAADAGPVYFSRGCRATGWRRGTGRNR